MSRGKGSSRSLISIINALHGHIASWRELDRKSHAALAEHKRHYANTQQNLTLPPRLYLDALRGEAILRTYFFGNEFRHFIARLPIDASEIQQIEYWQLWVENRGYLADFVRRLGLVAELAIATDVPSAQDNEWCYQLYLAFLSHLSEHSNEQALEDATTRFFLYLWKQRFPDLSHVQKQPSKKISKQSCNGSSPYFLQESRG